MGFRGPTALKDIHRCARAYRAAGALHKITSINVLSCLESLFSPLIPCGMAEICKIQSFVARLSLIIHCSALIIHRWRPDRPYGVPFSHMIAMI